METEKPTTRKDSILPAPLAAPLANETPSLLPIELVFDIALLLPLPTVLELALTCKNYYFALIPTFAQERLLKKFDSEEQVIAFAQDSLGAAKFSLVKTIAPSSKLGFHEYSSDAIKEFRCILGSGIVSKSCGSLRLLSAGIESAQVLVSLFSETFPSLEFLKLFVKLPEESDETTQLQVDLPSLTTLEVGWSPPLALYSALIDGCPKLRDVTLTLCYDFKYGACLERAPVKFLEKIKTVVCNHGQQLRFVLGIPSLKPHSIITQDLQGMDVWGWTVEGENVAIWRTIMQLDTVERFETYYLPSELLLLGLPPPKVESVKFFSLFLSGIPQELLPRLGEIFRKSSALIEIDVDLCHAGGLPQNEPEAIFWATLDLPNVKVAFDGNYDPTYKWEFASTLAERFWVYVADAL